MHFPYDVDGFRHMRVEVYLRKGGKAPKGGKAAEGPYVAVGGVSYGLYAGEDCESGKGVGGNG